VKDVKLVFEDSRIMEIYRGTTVREVLKDLNDDSINETYDEKIKLMVIGETRVGKTSLIKKYTKDEFGGAYLTTVGIDFQEKIIKIDDKTVKLQIWDTAGEERFRNIAKNYFHTSNGFLLVYDISNKESFEKLHFWNEQIKINAPENTRCIVIGNKTDLNDKREVSQIEGETFSKEYKIGFYETSAKEGTNVNNEVLIFCTYCLSFSYDFPKDSHRNC